MSAQWLRIVRSVRYSLSLIASTVFVLLLLVYWATGAEVAILSAILTMLVSFLMLGVLTVFIDQTEIERLGEDEHRDAP
jgi:archaellum biogenesis protein FlaJ (TadC family)